MGQIKRLTAKRVIAEHYSTDMGDLEEYQHTYKTKRMFVVGEEVHAATPDNEQPPSDLQWQEVTSDWTRSRCPGWKVWKEIHH